jgi:uncharacterized protein YlxW (UPF0749 family)
MADAPPRLPPQATMGLLEYLTTHAVDEDYAFASARRTTRAGPTGGDDLPAPSRRRIGVVGAVVMALFAVLVVTAAAQTSRNAVSDQQERRDLASQVSDARSQLADDRTRAAALQRETSTMQAAQLAGDRAGRTALDNLRRLGTITGTVAVRGPGVRVVANDAPDAASARNQVLDTDLQKLVNGLWQAGAEAIALNGQRLTNLSTIRLAGGAITVNARSLRRPYVVTAIGDKDTLPARFAETSSGQAWLDLQREVGLRLSITPESSLRLPATEVSLHYATRPTPGGAP